MGDLQPAVKLFVAACAVASSLFGLWCVGVAFIGGTIPIAGWELEGGIASGLLFLLFVEPIVVTVGYWLAMLVALPLQLLLSRRKS